MDHSFSIYTLFYMQVNYIYVHVYNIKSIKTNKNALNKNWGFVPINLNSKLLKLGRELHSYIFLGRLFHGLRIGAVIGSVMLF